MTREFTQRRRVGCKAIPRNLIRACRPRRLAAVSALAATSSVAPRRAASRLYHLSLNSTTSSFPTSALIEPTANNAPVTYKLIDKSD